MLLLLSIMLSIDKFINVNVRNRHDANVIAMCIASVSSIIVRTGPSALLFLLPPFI